MLQVGSQIDVNNTIVSGPECVLLPLFPILHLALPFEDSFLL